MTSARRCGRSPQSAVTINGLRSAPTLTTGVYDFVTWTLPAPDADGDGIENGLDPCPYTDSSAWDPRGAKTQPGADTDGDGIPDDCDPDPNNASLGTAGDGISQADEDNDGWQNMGDNCPLVANGPNEISAQRPQEPD